MTDVISRLAGVLVVFTIFTAPTAHARLREITSGSIPKIAVSTAILAKKSASGRLDLICIVPLRGRDELVPPFLSVSPVAFVLSGSPFHGLIPSRSKSRSPSFLV